VYPRLTAAAVVTKTLDCSGSPDAVITTITGGRAPFTFPKGSGTPSVVPSVAQHLLPRQCQCRYVRLLLPMLTVVLQL
jgi:hypothetical protein